MSNFSNNKITRTMALVLVTVYLFAITSAKGGCEFPAQWSGSWFQSGTTNPIKVNTTHIDTKGKCIENDKDKFLMHDHSGGDNCYRCVVINQKHPSVLQYKETYCEEKASLQDICYGITGDAPLYSMFRLQPPAEPVPCPFKGAPFMFSYNRGSGECMNPPSRAESCTDDSRLVLKYQSCPDVGGTESNVEQLICLAVWKEGSTRYMIGRVLQPDRRSAGSTEENQYRCFVYERVTHQGGRGVTYNIAQSGDATCNGVQNALEGSKTIKLTTVDDHHNRCRFPLWLTEHHTWHSLDHRLSYRFSQRNATLRVTADDSSPSTRHLPYGESLPYGAAQFNSRDDDTFGNIPFHSAHVSSGHSNYGSHSHIHGAHLAEGSEVRLVCHSILQAQEKKKVVQIVAHVTAGCKSGHVCMVFYKRDNNVIEVQQSTTYQENPDDACRYFDAVSTPFTTLITTSLHTKKCPHLGRYTVINPTLTNDRRKRRQNMGSENLSTSGNDCAIPKYESLTVGCSGSHETMELKSSCGHSSTQTVSAYSCHGSWEENGTSYLIASPIGRKSTDPYRYCFIYNVVSGIDDKQPQSHLSGTSVPINSLPNVNGGKVALQNTVIRGGILQLSAVADSCHRIVIPGMNHALALNLTSNGTCADTDDNTNTARRLIPATLFILSLILTIAIVR